MGTIRTLSWLVVIIYSTIPTWWLAIHPFARYWRSWQRSPYRALVPLWFAMWIAAGAITWPWRNELLYTTPYGWILSALLLAVSIPIYRRMRPEFGPQNYVGQAELRPKEFGQKLIITGMHARLRHPIYLAHLCTIAAFTVGSGMVVNFYLLAFATVTGFVMIKTEERELEKRFGQAWRDYANSVPAFFPRRREAIERFVITDSTIAYEIGGRAAWVLDPKNLVCIAEYTTAAGPGQGDYFLVLALRDGQDWTASLYAAGRDEVIGFLSKELDHPLVLRLFNSATFNSRIMWPPALEGSEFFVRGERDDKLAVNPLLSRQRAI